MRSIRESAIGSWALVMVLAGVLLLTANTGFARDAPRGYQMLQVSYGPPSGLPLPINLWAWSGWTEDSPPETRLPSKIDAETKLRLEQNGHILSCRVKMRVGNGRRRGGPVVQTLVEFLGEGGVVISSKIIRKNARGIRSVWTDWEGCSFAMPAGQKLVEVRMYHKTA